MPRDRKVSCLEKFLHKDTELNQTFAIKKFRKIRLSENIVDNISFEGKEQVERGKWKCKSKAEGESLTEWSERMGKARTEEFIIRTQ